MATAPTMVTTRPVMTCASRLLPSSTDDANKLYRQAEILLNDLPAIPLYYSNASGVASLNVKSGYAFDWQNLPTYTGCPRSESDSLNGYR